MDRSGSSRTEPEQPIGGGASFPEKKVTLLAVRLAALEKAASAVGDVEFTWGTVVMLGSFAGSLDKADFCFIAAILLIKGSWNFSTTHRLQQHRIRSKMGLYLVWIQLASAISCVLLSLIKLVVHPNLHQDNCDKRNIKLSLIIFYALALAGALLFLFEKAYWEWEVSRGRLFQSVGGSDWILIETYFHYAYSKCINGSIFDGSNTDMVSFGMDLILGDNSLQQHLIGAEILRNFATSLRFSQDTLHMIGINLAVREKLLDMLSWKDAEIRYYASEILLKLATEKRHSLRIAGALESIASLLTPNVSNENYGLDPLRSVFSLDPPIGCSCSVRDDPLRSVFSFALFRIYDLLEKIIQKNEVCEI